MNAFSHNDLSHQNADRLRALAVEQSQLLALATQVIRKLEKTVEILTIVLGAKNQKTLFAAESLEKMRHVHFGRPFEQRVSDHASPLFSLFTQLSDAALSDGSQDESGPDPKIAKHPIKRGLNWLRRKSSTQLMLLTQRFAV